MRLAAARKRRSSSSDRLDNHCTPGTAGLPARLASSTLSCSSLPPLGRPSPELVSAVTPTSAALATPPVLITPGFVQWIEQFSDCDHNRRGLVFIPITVIPGLSPGFAGHCPLWNVSVTRAFFSSRLLARNRIGGGGDGRGAPPRRDGASTSRACPASARAAYLLRVRGRLARRGIGSGDSSASFSAERPASAFHQRKFCPPRRP